MVSKQNNHYDLQFSDIVLKRKGLTKLLFKKDVMDRIEDSKMLSDEARNGLYKHGPFRYRKSEYVNLQIDEKILEVRKPTENK